MEAMKMELSLKAPVTGSIAVLNAEVDQFVEADTLLIRIDSQSE